MDRALLLACVICGILFSVLGLASLFILWTVNWRPWRIYRYLVEILYVSICLFGLGALDYVGKAVMASVCRILHEDDVGNAVMAS
ncbi:Calpain-type cysteine protease DEK1, partial [Mucuna pruriens]